MANIHAKHRRWAWAVLRIGMGWIFLWAFFDKLFGLGFATCRDAGTGAVNYLCEAAWINGGSPTFGFLTYATKGPFEVYFKTLATSTLVEWLFMLGLLFVGITLALGIMVRLGGMVGIALLFLMYLAGFFPPDNNPVVDNHLMYIVVLVGVILADAGKTCGLGGGWCRLKLVRKYPILR